MKLVSPKSLSLENLTSMLCSFKYFHADPFSCISSTPPKISGCKMFCSYNFRLLIVFVFGFCEHHSISKFEENLNDGKKVHNT